MKDYIRSVVDPALTENENINRLREYLQAYFLYVLYKTKHYQNLVFTGGTALRFVHKIRRYSEDLDFSLSAKAQGYDFAGLIKKLQQEFELAGYSLEIKHASDRPVHSAMLKFSEILFDTGLSPMKSAKFWLKLEIDTNPPRGGKEELSTYSTTFMFYMLHYDLASLFAGKVHALLCREYTKGRDWYDLVWYLTKFRDIEPNYALLNNAIKQTHKGSAEINAGNWRQEIRKAVDNVSWAKVRDEVARFLEDPVELDLLRKETFASLLNKK